MGNAVHRLRQQQLAVAQREFKARGAKTKRCEHCMVGKAWCICNGIEVADCDVAVCLLMYRKESFKPSNTGKLIADIIPDNHAFCWDRTEPAPQLLALLQNPDYQPFVVFPEENMPPQRITHKIQRLPGKTPLLIFLDGTWREAKKMIRKSPYLDHLPILSVTPEKLSDYQLRVAYHDHHLGTAEVAVMVLELAGEKDAADKLQRHFNHFREAYLRTKPRQQTTKTV